MIRIGLGRDLHRLAAGRKFILGGVEIPCPIGEAGHSDGDVLTHAVIDALLGAAGLGDIGEFFPSTDDKWKDASSLVLLQSVCGKVKKAGFSILNIDCVVSCEKPAMLPYRKKIITSLASILGINEDEVFVKGKTGEGIGDIGEGRAVEAIAVCVLEKANIA